MSLFKEKRWQKFFSKFFWQSVTLPRLDWVVMMAVKVKLVGKMMTQAVMIGLDL